MAVIRKAEKKAVAPEAAKPVEKAPRKRVQKAAPSRKEDVILQFGGQEWNTAELLEQAKTAYVAEGHRMSSIKTIRLYVKPEEQKAYYVINDKATGSIEL